MASRVERESHADFLSALRDGVSSVEVFVTRQAARWNVDHPADRLEEKDKSGRFVSFRKKLEEWCPKITGERMPPEELARLLTIKRYRDDVAVHGKQTVAAIGLNELAQLLNGFTFDLAVPFFSLHRMFRLMVPPIILRAAYAPVVSVRTESPPPNSR